MPFRQIIVLLLFVLTPSTSLYASHPAERFPDILQPYIAGATSVITCETSDPRRVGTVFYEHDSAQWLIRAFFKDGKLLEMWMNYAKSYFSLWWPDLIFYYEDPRGWLSKEQIDEDRADSLDKRLKFTDAEKDYFRKCYEEKNKNP